MPAPIYYSLTVPSTGYAQRFPSAQPANSCKQMTITANATNSGPISTTATGRLLPGGGVTVCVEDSGALFLSGAIGDGIGYTY